ncbi:MAG: tRNA (N6-isopentenyl adenosine(37)-C2)-methylthiotransferase MiaB [Candidatus Humimicrobiaceae bacterium]
MKKYFIETFGCQMNEFDSERIAYLLDKEGYAKVNKPEESDAVIINTCAVRENAKNKLYGHIGSLKNLKLARPDLLICIGGCSAQNLKEQILQVFPFVDIIFGTHNISELPELISKKIISNGSICDIKDTGFDYMLSDFKNTYSFKACLPISIGCNNYCSYCIVPYVRGKEKSIDAYEIIKTAKNLVLNGVSEITLLGQNVNSYGKDFENNYEFPDLLEKIAGIEGLKRIRFMTSHPKDLSNDLIDVIARHSNIANHIHLPLQSGSDKILGAMNRKYSKDDYLEIIKNIRRQIPECSITTDIIVGFPGEDYEDFKETMDVIEKVRFNKAFTFIFSKREGTYACKLEDATPPEEKKKWFKELLLKQNKISNEENESFVGKTYEVLVEGSGSKGMIQGRLENNSIVNFEGSKDLEGKFINLTIIQAKSFYLIGEIQV